MIIEKYKILDLLKNITSFFENSKLLTVAFIIFISFHNRIENLLYSLLGEPFLSYIERNIVITGFFVLTVIFQIYILAKNIKKKQYISNCNIYSHSLLFILWVYYRFFNDQWDWIKLYEITVVKYIDLYLIYYAALVIVKVIKLCQKKKEINKKNGFFHDNPIDKITDDCFGRNKYAQDLANRIRSTPLEKGTFSVGINGTWGTGKSSFLYLLEKELENDYILV